MVELDLRSASISFFSEQPRPGGRVAAARPGVATVSDELTTRDVRPVATTGRCLCGDVRFEVRGPLRDVYDCYCERCRRFSGHHMAATAADPRDVTIEGSELVNWFAPDPTVEYGSCSRCGSSMFWRADALPDHLSIAAGVLQQPTGLATTQAWFVAEAGDYHERCGGMVEHEGDGSR